MFLKKMSAALGLVFAISSASYAIESPKEKVIRVTTQLDGGIFFRTTYSTLRKSDGANLDAQLFSPDPELLKKMYATLLLAKSQDSYVIFNWDPRDVDADQKITGPCKMPIGISIVE